MDKEIKVINFFDKLLENPDDKKFITNLVLFHDMTLSYENIKINHDENFTYEQRQISNSFGPYKFIDEHNGRQYWLYNLCKLKDCNLSNLGVFSKEMYDELYENIKIIIENHILPLNEQFINNYSDYEYLKNKFLLEPYSKNYIEEKRFIENVYNYSLNNILKKLYDLWIELSIIDNNFIIENRYNEIINDKIKNYLMQNVKVYKKSIIPMQKHQDISLLFYNDIFNNSHKYYKGFVFSFNKVCIINYVNYIEMFNLILNEITEISNIKEIFVKNNIEEIKENIEDKEIKIKKPKSKKNKENKIVETENIAEIKKSKSKKNKEKNIVETENVEEIKKSKSKKNKEKNIIETENIEEIQKSKTKRNKENNIVETENVEEIKKSKSNIVESENIKEIKKPKSNIIEIENIEEIKKPKSKKNKEKNILETENIEEIQKPKNKKNKEKNIDEKDIIK